MKQNHSSSLAHDFAAALEWWKLAGVSQNFLDDATDWLEEAPSVELSKPQQTTLSPSSSTPETGDLQKKVKPQQNILPQDAAPTNLEEFCKWWLEDPALDPRGVKGRIAPHGAHNSKLMVLVVDPEAQDTDTLLSGPCGALLSKILKASGLAQEDIYYASVLPTHTPLANGEDLLAKGYAEVLALHITLAAPQNILSLGSNTLPLLAHGAPEETVNKAGSLHEFNHDNRTTPMFVGESLEGLMGSPTLKARFWRQWIQWIERLD